MIMATYRVYKKDNPEDFKIIEIPEEYLEERGKGQMAIKDYACLNGHYSWADYEELRAKKN